MIPEEYRLIALFTIIGTLLVLLVWGRYRYDIVAFGALIITVIAGIIPSQQAFDGFGHQATIIVALVLIISRGFANSGAVDWFARLFIRAGRHVSSHIAIMAGIGASLSTVMNNIAALALLMPVDLQAAERAKRSPAVTLMPLSFATILGGLVTMIGTPPNIIVSSIREQHLGQPFQMFDYTPVGLACAFAGVIFVAFIGWRLLPKSTRERQAGKELFEVGTHLIELNVQEKSKVIGKTPRDLDDVCDEYNVAIIEILRDGQRLPSYSRWLHIQSNDILLIETVANKLDGFVNALELSYGNEKAQVTEPDVQAKAANTRHNVYGKALPANKSNTLSTDQKSKATQDNQLVLAEVVMLPGASVEGYSAARLRLKDQTGTWLIGISRQGRKMTDRVRHVSLKAGDVLLLMGLADRIRKASDWMGTLPLTERGLHVSDRKKALQAASLFAVAILLSSIGIIQLPVALAGIVVLYTLLNIVPLRQLYESIEWPVVVLIGSLIPIGIALQTSGGAQIIAKALVNASQGAEPWMILTALMVVTIMLSDMLNNTATALIAAPVAISVAEKLNVSADPFLMGVAIASSSAFMTPIGHNNNTLIMGPGGYRFGDYWRIGLPLEILIVSVSVPLILVVWPF